jgi:hypothetical protein
MHSGAPLQGAGNQPLGHRRDFYTTKFPALCLWKSVVLNTILNATAIATVTQIAELRTTENMTLKGETIIVAQKKGRSRAYCDPPSTVSAARAPLR